MRSFAHLTTMVFLLALSELCAADTTTQPASQESKAEMFMLVKVHGTIGDDFSAAKMKAAISEARKAKATTIVLSVDTPGGSVPEAEAIVNLIIESKDLRFVALVRKALSAGAPITLACKDIYATETATIGAAVSYVPDKRGRPIYLPTDVREKMQSAWRAICRKAADHGGHSSLLAEGMVDSDFAIAMRKEMGKVILERIDRAFFRTRRTESGKVVEENEMTGKGELLKPRGRILTLTAKEAVNCELAKAVVNDLKSLAESIDIPEWKDATIGPVVRGPTPFYSLVLEKIEALDFASRQTELARKTAEKEWDTWFNAKWRKVRGTRISWTLTLREAKPSKRGTIEVNCTAPVPKTFKRTSQLFESIAINANVRALDKNTVAAISPGAPITITGRIAGISFYGAKLRPALYDKDGKVIRWYDMGTMPVDRPVRTLRSISIQLAGCSVGDEKRAQPLATPNAPAIGPVGPEAEAKRQLSLAETYERNGMNTQALKILRSIIKDFPDTATAKEAAVQLKDLEKEISEKVGKDS